MLAEKSDTFGETGETIFKLNQDDAVRYWCEAREDGERILRTYQHLLAEKDNALAKKDSALAEKDSALAEMRARIAYLESQLKQN